MVVNGQNKWRSWGTKKTDSGGAATESVGAVLSGSFEIDIGDGFTNRAFLNDSFLFDQPSH